MCMCVCLCACVIIRATHVLFSAQLVQVRVRITHVGAGCNIVLTFFFVCFFVFIVFNTFIIRNKLRLWIIIAEREGERDTDVGFCFFFVWFSFVLHNKIGVIQRIVLFKQQKRFIVVVIYMG